MKIQYKIYAAIFSFIVIGIGCLVLLPKEPKRNEDALLKVGAGDDISGLVMKESLKRMDEEYGNIKEQTTGNAFADCCSNTAQWAMNAGDINAAFYCSHIAKHTVENNSELMIYAPVIMNAEMIAYKKDWEDVQTLGILQGRKKEQTLAKKAYVQIRDIYEISQKGIGYSLEDGQIDGAILDITKAANIPDYHYKNLSGEDYISYVLVVKKDLVGTEIFREFIEAYNEGIQRLREETYLSECLGVDRKWLKNTNIKFLTLSESGKK